MTTQDSQLLQLIHQVQSHQISNIHALMLYILLSIPVSTVQKLNIYYRLSLLPIPEVSPFQLTLLIILGPIGLIVLLFILIPILYRVIGNCVSLVLSRIGHNQPEKKLLQLTFPADTGKSAFATEELYRLLHTLSRQLSFWDSVIQRKNEYSLEIASTREGGIRYLLAAQPKFIDIISRNFLSYLPGIKITEVNDYLDSYVGNNTHNASAGIVELKLSGHFALSLETQKALSENDPISYITGNMTKLLSGELISCQVIVSPVISSIHKQVIFEITNLRQRIYKGQPLTGAVQKNTLQKFVSLPGISILWFVIKRIWKIVSFTVMFVYSMIIGLVDTSGKSVPFLKDSAATLPQEILNPYEKELSEIIKTKIDQQLFETSIRILVVSPNPDEVNTRLNELLASFGQFSSLYQTFTVKHSLFPSQKCNLNLFKLRRLSQNTSGNLNPILSASELSDLFHFPYTNTTKTEGFVKSKSKDLPAPLSLKKDTTQLDVIIGKNNYGGEETLVGLTQAQRHEHTYIVGKTGMGKTTIIKQMAYQDILSGKGVAVIDPHGDLVKELVRIIPESRKKDVISLDPMDKAWPIGLNILSPGGTFVDEEEKTDWITGSVISVFMKITPKANWGQRMEHILRNATMTALTTEAPTLMTIQKLLTNTGYRQQVTAVLKDPVLKQFWVDEFKMYGSMQRADIISPLTNKLGEFITSPMSRHILLQTESTIELSDIMDNGKILLVNLSKGSLGEERSSFFGTLIISLIQMAAYQRAQIQEDKRKDFFLYIDEFQNFATVHFADMFSEARKFHVFIIPSHQNVAQIDEVKTAKEVLENSGTIISLKNGPDDEAVILPFMAPEVEKGEIVNLPPYHFFMKVTNENSEDAFSGETIPLTIKGYDQVKDFIIDNTRKHYATPRAVVEKQLDILFGAYFKTGSEEKKLEVKTDKKTQKRGLKS